MQVTGSRSERPAGAGPALPEFGRFFLPGPTEVRPEVLAAQLGPMIGHRTREMEALMQRAQQGLRAIFRTKRPVYVAASSATGMMEAAVRNGARRRVLSLVNGAFSDRFARIAEMNGLEVERAAVPWGEPNTPEQLGEALSRADFDAVTVVHSETSTGVLNPIEALARVAHDAGDVVLLVDAVSSLGGAMVHTDAWALDFVLTGSQKAMALPPGLAFGVARPNVLERARAKPDRGLYFDFVAFEKNMEKEQTPNTPAVSLFYALALQAERFLEEGVDRRYERHRAMAERCWGWVDGMADAGYGLAVVAPDGYRSETVTCIRVPEPWTGPGICSELTRRGWVIAPGYGEHKQRMIRIGHMGDHTIEELDALLAQIEDIVRHG